jgi:hypothetical protein
MMTTVESEEDSKPHAGFARLTDDYWLVNVSAGTGATGGEGVSKREALASIGLGDDEISYLMSPGRYSIEDFRHL